MTLQVIGAGLGRTGTFSLKLALNQLGLGPTHHMSELFPNMATQVPLWTEAVKGRPDWTAIYQGYNSAVDWPTASFYPELRAAYPSAKFVLTARDAESWADSFSETIHKAMTAPMDAAPPERKAWFEMARAVLAKAGVTADLDRAGQIAAYRAHNQAVKAAIPASHLLVYDVRQGWEPLCEFLGVTAPETPFPKTNDRAEFIARLAARH